MSRSSSWTIVHLYCYLSLSVSLFLFYFLSATVKLSLALIHSLIIHSSTVSQSPLLSTKNKAFSTVSQSPLLSTQKKKHTFFFSFTNFDPSKAHIYFVSRFSLSLSHSYFKQFHSLFSLKPCLVAENQRNPILPIFSTLHRTSS